VHPPPQKRPASPPPAATATATARCNRGAAAGRGVARFLHFATHVFLICQEVKGVEGGAAGLLILAVRFRSSGGRREGVVFQQTLQLPARHPPLIDAVAAGD
jgi:hypothetical protein